MIERRTGRERRSIPSADVSDVEHALDTVRRMRPQILEYVRRYGPGAAGYFDRAIAGWYRGTLAERATFVQRCSADPALAAAWSIVHAAGSLAAPLIPVAVRRYYEQSSVDAFA